MSNLLELAIDLINDAKSGKDAQGKLYLLEQVKEICFHRDKAVLKEVIPNILDFMVEKSASIKKFLIKFGDEAMSQDSQLSFPYYINLLNFLLSDTNDGVLTLLAKSFHKYYDIVLMKVVAMPIVAKAQGLSDPKQLWQLFSSITSRFNDLITTNRAEALKASCLKVYESEMTFGLPSSAAPATADPRLARKDPRLARAGKATTAAQSSTPADAASKNAEEIPLHHPFISRNEIQSAAEDNFTRALLWSSKGGPQTHPFTPALMSVLGQVIANVASSRLKHASTAAKALVAMLQSKGNVAEEMSGVDRGNLARAVHRLLRSATAYTADPEGMMPKLRTAVASLEALGLDVAASSAADGAAGQSSVLKKRGANAGGEGDDEEGDEGMRRSSAVAAIDAAERKMKLGSGFPGLDMFGEGGDGDAIAMLLAQVSTSKPAVKATTGFGGMLISGDTTELAKDLAAHEGMGAVSSLKLVSTTPASAGGSVAQTPLAASEEQYGDLALCSLQKLLESYRVIELSDAKMLKPFSVMCVKAVLAMAISEVAARRSLVPVQIVSIIPVALAGKLSPDVPPHVTLPRSLWNFLGFILGEHAAPVETGMDEKWEEELQRKVGILSQLCAALCEEIAWQVQEREEDQQSGEYDPESDIVEALQRTYDAFCVAAVSRLVQIVQLRSSAGAFLLNLPAIPRGGVALLKLLAETGGKAAGAGSKDKNAAAEQSRNRGTRAEALALMAQVVFAQDESAGKDSLMFILQHSLSEDFEVRAKVINLIISELVNVDDWCDEIVIRFAVQALIGAVGVDVLSSWVPTVPSGVPAGDEGGEPQHHETGDEEDAVQMGEEGDAEMVLGDEEDGEGEQITAGDRPFSLVASFRQYQEDESIRALFPSVGAADRESYTKRAVQLLSQLCLVELSVLGAFSQLYAAWKYGIDCGGGGVVAEDSAAAALVADGTAGAEDGMEAPAEDVAAPSDDTTGETVDKTEPGEGNIVAPTAGKRAVVWTLAETLKTELRNILPAIVQSKGADSVFDALSTNQDAAVRPLLEVALHALLHDFTVPPTPALIQKVRDFALRVADKPTEAAALDEMETSGADEHKETEGMDVAASDASAPVIQDLTDVESFRLMLPLVGGIPGTEFEACLPRIIALHAEDAEALKNVFSRVTRARPPPMTKSALLVALHRIDYEKHQLKAKSVLDAIAVCLNNKADFSGEVIKEALKAMLVDEVPPSALMRTAILSSQSFSDVKRYVLSDVMPQLVRKCIWATAPKLWDGVIYGAKNLATAGFKNSELTLRALLGIPVIQLKGLLRVAPTVKAAMGKLLKTLSAEEKEEVTSGRWAGLVEDAPSSEEKQKLIKEIAASVTI